MAVPEQTPIIEYIANGSTTEFVLGFECEVQDYLKVTVDGFVPSVGTWSLVGNAVVFLIAPMSGSVIKIKRQTDLKRTTDYQAYDNSFRPAPVNKDFDTIWHVLQELNLDNSLTDQKLQELIDQIVDGNINGLPAEILARIAGDQENLNLINAESLRAYIAEQVLESKIQDTENNLNNAISAETNRAISVEQGLQTQVDSLGGGASFGYTSYAEMVANAANIPAHSVITVGGDPDSSKDGQYIFDGSVFNKSPYDPLNQSKGYSDSNAFFKPKAIIVNDLNLLIEEGYHYADATSSANIANKPTGVTGSFFILVRRQGTSNILMQEIVDNQLQSFKRRRPNATDWTTYEQFTSRTLVSSLIAAALAIGTVNNGDDLNNYLTTGVWFTGSAFDNILNKPPQVPAAFKFEVEAKLVSGNNIVYQTITSHQNIVLKRRFNGSVWTVWDLQKKINQELAVATDLNSFVGDGTWFVQSVNNGLISNKPSIATHAFTISNVGYTFGANTACLQTITNHLNRSVSRRTANSGTTWTTFDEIVTTANVADIIAPYIPEIPSDIGVFGTYIKSIGTKLAAYQLPSIAQINHFLSYGQSLSIGAGGQPAISLTQYASNLTFAGGPRAAAGNYLPPKPLVEDDLNAPDGGTNRGETLCSGAANYASQQMLKQNGIKPQDHVILATAGGRGGYRISQLNKGTPWYDNNMLAHIDNAVNHCTANALSYSMALISWAQGEFDQNKTDITRAQYATMLEQLQVDMQTDIKTRSGMKTRIPFVTYQTSWYVKKANHVSLAQLDVVKRNEDFYFSTPMYHLPHFTDDLHLNNVGNKLFGCYVGRVYKQLIIDQIHPEFLCPLSAEMQGTKIIVRFHVPKAPLVLDNVGLAATTDHGFKVVDNAGATVAHSSIAVSSDGTKIEIELGAVPSNPIKVRYALDYLGVGLTIGDGASGNLRDSTTDQVSFNGNTYNLWHVCPHFELDILNLQV